MLIFCGQTTELLLAGSIYARTPHPTNAPERRAEAKDNDDSPSNRNRNHLRRSRSPTSTAGWICPPRNLQLRERLHRRSVRPVRQFCAALLHAATNRSHERSDDVPVRVEVYRRKSEFGVSSSSTKQAKFTMSALGRGEARRGGKGRGSAQLSSARRDTAQHSPAFRTFLELETFLARFATTKN